MKRIVSSALLLVLFAVGINLYAQTADGGIFGAGTTLTVKFKPSAGITGGFTGGNFGIRWLTSLGAGVNLTGETSSFGYVNQGAKATSGSYDYIVYASGSLVTSTTYSAGVEYTLMTVTVTGGVGTGSFELTPGGFASDAGQWYIEIGGSDKANSTPASWYYQASAAGVTLPVELTSFTASVNRFSTNLNWSTATETNNAGFEVERRAVRTQQSAVGEWTKVGFVAGAGTSVKPTQYSYIDQGVTPGTYDYRIKQIDKSGTFKYSSATSVEVGLAAKVLSLADNYPNPFNPSTNFEFSLPKDGRASLKVYNMIGQEVATLFDGEGQAGRIIQAKFDARNLASGLYFARLQFDGKSLMKKITLLK